MAPDARVGDDGSLELTQSQLASLAALQEDVWRRRATMLPGTRDVAVPAPVQRAIGADLPACPLGAPPKPISAQVDPATGDLYLRCLHTTADPGPHCWDLTGKRRSKCS